MDISCALTMSQEMCFGASFTDEETKSGDHDCIAQLTWTLAVRLGLSKSALRRKLGNSFLTRCESHDSWIRILHR